jgi:pimeloyl-ACP methyl ester carboxylesterase
VSEGDSPAGRVLGRRAVLGGAALAGGTLALAACATGPPVRPPDGPVPGFRLFAEPDLDFEASFALGAAAYGAAEVGEVLTVAERIRGLGASYETFVDQFLLLGRRLAGEADGALARGRRVTARSSALRAAYCGKQALYFILGTVRRADEARLYATMQAQWDRAASLFTPPFERVAIPYEGGALPGYLLRPTVDSARRPTVILNNGSDGQNVDLWVYGGAAALERGYNALIFEGPGQGAMLFERRQPFRPDWERVVTPVVDFLAARPEVDPARIAIIGWSMGGGLVARAAAFEPRLAAVCLDPGVADLWQSWPAGLRRLAAAGDAAEVNRLWRSEILDDLTPRQTFTLMKRSQIFGAAFLDAARAGRVTTDFAALARAVVPFSYAGVLPRITAPVLVTAYEGEQFNPPEAPRQVLDGLRGPKRLHVFTRREGAGGHDAPLAPRRRNEVIFDWLDEVLS